MPVDKEAKRVVVYRSGIVKILTPEGLVYTDRNGVTRTIEFAQCRRNAVHHFYESEGYHVRGLRVADSNCVGQRDAGARPRYIEFFTEPPTRFAFTWRCWRPYRRFREFADMLIGAGASTYDLS